METKNGALHFLATSFEGATLFTIEATALIWTINLASNSPRKDNIMSVSEDGILLLKVPLQLKMLIHFSHTYLEPELTTVEPPRKGRPPYKGHSSGPPSP